MLLTEGDAEGKVGMEWVVRAEMRRGGGGWLWGEGGEGKGGGGLVDF